MEEHKTGLEIVAPGSNSIGGRSILHAGTFGSSSRLEGERAVVLRNFPPGTRQMSMGGGGWLYSFTCEFGNFYQLYIYHDGSIYQVKCVVPEMEGRFNVHNCHLHHDGRICLTETTMGGYPDFETTYAKSIVWANGFSVFLASNKFPFSTNND